MAIAPDKALFPTEKCGYFLHGNISCGNCDYSHNMLSITVTCLYNFDSLKPHFYTVKLGFTGVYIIFLIFAQKHRLWVRNLCFEQKYENYQSFLSENVQFLEVKFSMYLNRRVFVIRGKKKKKEENLYADNPLIGSYKCNT